MQLGVSEKIILKYFILFKIDINSREELEWQCQCPGCGENQRESKCVHGENCEPVLYRRVMTVLQCDSITVWQYYSVTVLYRRLMTGLRITRIIILSKSYYYFYYQISFPSDYFKNHSHIYSAIFYVNHHLNHLK